jgi:hypothetical protein
MSNASKKHSAVVDARRSAVASLLARHLSVREIVAALEKDGHANPSTKKPWAKTVVDDDRQYLTAAWRAEAEKDTAEWIAHDLAELDEAGRESWSAWRRGIGKRRVTFSEQREGGGDGKGGSKASVRTEDLNGDPRHIANVIVCQERRAKLLGLDAPTRIDAKLTTPGVMFIPVTSLAEWEAAAEASQQALKDDVRN